jgi:hypothetical protein
MLRIAAVTLVVGATLLMSWALAPATARPALDRPGMLDASLAAGMPLLVQAADDLDRLRERLRGLPPYQPPARDPFRVRTPAAVTPESGGETPTVSAPALPRLVAILTSDAADTPSPRAAVSVNGVIRVVGAGDLIGALQVVRVTADAILLLDPSTRATFRLTLR